MQATPTIGITTNWNDAGLAGWTNATTFGTATTNLTNPGGITIMKVTPDGFVWAQEVKVKVFDPYPDFVFLTNFKLMSLPELERFVKENKHLPSVPAEKDINENGLDLGKMNILLLQKVEELTLYIIEMNKKIELLEKKIKISNN